MGIDLLINHPDYVHGMLMMHERGMSQQRIAQALRLSRPRVALILQAAREASAWQTKFNARKTKHDRHSSDDV